MSKHTPGPTMETNARLIAAARQMLEALLEAEQFLADAPNAQHRKCAEKCRAAIAAAVWKE